jgi:hypothetical protein
MYKIWGSKDSFGKWLFLFQCIKRH